MDKDRSRKCQKEEREESYLIADELKIRTLCSKRHSNFLLKIHIADTEVGQVPFAPFIRQMLCTSSIFFRYF